MTDPSPTPEQSAILDAAASTTSNIMIQAYAGTGKTSTLELLDGVTTPHPHLYLVFNKANAVEAQRRLRSTTNVRTFNSLGHRIWGSACSRNLALDTKKINTIFREIVADLPKSEATEAWSVYDEVTSGVNLARALGYIPPTHAHADRSLIDARTFWSALDEKPSAFVAELIDSILTTSIRLALEGTIDFADQCYMPALFGGNYPRFPLVLIDEYQDLSPIQHAMVERLCVSSRQIGVGDEAQSIYGFRGAKAGSMRHAISKFSMDLFPLSISFRCPSAIVHNVRWRVPKFTASRDGGSVETSTTSAILDDSAVICRNNAPLVSLAMELLQSGRPVNISGIDIATRLLRIMTRLGPESLTQTQTLDAIAQWLADKLDKDSKTATDTAACMRVFASRSPTLGSAIAYVKHLTSLTGPVTFLSGHKSKGLEFDHVYHLSPELIKRGVGQEDNIRYVIDTRSRDRLTYI